MLSWLKTNVESARQSLAAEASKFKNRDFMEAVVAGCAMMAHADGSVSAEEKQKMMGFIDRADELKHFDNRDIIKMFNASIEDFEFDAAIGKGNALRTIGKIKKNGEQARLLIRVVCAIGAADGDFDENERTMAREICVDLGLAPGDFDL